MTAAAFPPDESARLASLRSFDILDTPDESLYDDIVLLASELCDSPIALISLIDEDRQWFKARKGLQAHETPRESAFCAHAILLPDELMLVEDATSDPRFRDNPLVTGDPHIRFYAGAPIVTPDGKALGTVCVIDRERRVLTPRQATALQALARQVGALLQLRRSNRELQNQSRTLRDVTRMAQARQQRSADMLDVVLRSGELGLWELQLPDGAWVCDARERAMLGYGQGHGPQHDTTGFTDASQPANTADTSRWRDWVHPEDMPGVMEALDRHIRGEIAQFSSEHRLRQRDGQWMWVRSSGMVMERDAHGVATRVVGTDWNITARRAERQAVLQVNSILQRTSALAQVGGWHFELATGAVNWTQEVYRIHELEPSVDLSLVAALDFYPPESRPVMEEALEAAMRDGTPYDLELAFVTARGRKRWVRAQGVAVMENGKTVRLEGAFQDVTEQRAVQHAMELSEERLQLALAGTQSAVFDWNLGTGLIHRGAHFSVMRGGPAEATTWNGAQLLSLIHPDDLPLVWEKAIAVLKGEAPLYEMEYRITTLDQRWIWIRTVARVSERSPGGRALRCTGIDENITERKNSQLRVAESETRLKAITDHLPVLIAELDPQMRFIFCNATFKQWLGVDPSELLGKKPADLPTSVDLVACTGQLQKALSGTRVSFEQTIAGPPQRILQSNYVPRLDAAGQVRGLYAISSDITLQKDVERQLRDLAQRDPLTGISNRRHFEEDLSEAMARCRRNGGSIGLFYLDIDHFKSINDRFGHAVGDAVLREYARRVQSCVRVTDKFARQAGDEFVLLLEPCANALQAQRVADKILAAVRAPLTDLPGFNGPMTTSIGGALHHGAERETPAILLQRADQALYLAKSMGRDRLSFGELDSPG